MLLLGLFILQLLLVVEAYPSGAPTGACEDMMPRHAGISPQTSPAPYSIVTNSRTFQPGQPITVTITGPDYRGVLLEARSGSSTNALGTWQLPPPDTRFLQCSGNPHGAVTHANTNVKGSSTVFSWIPPSTEGPIYFMATVAQQRSVYWLNVRSSTLTSAKLNGLGLATSGSSRIAEEKHFLLLVMGFLSFQFLW